MKKLFCFILLVLTLNSCSKSSLEERDLPFLFICYGEYGKRPAFFYIYPDGEYIKVEEKEGDVDPKAYRKDGTAVNPIAVKFTSRDEDAEFFVKPGKYFVACFPTGGKGYMAKSFLKEEYIPCGVIADFSTCRDEEGWLPWMGRP